MKNKLHNQIKILNYITSTEKFKLIFIIIIILALYASIALSIPGDNYIDSSFIPFQFPIFNLIMSIAIFLNTLNTCTTFNKKFSNYIIRLENKENYIKELIKTTITMSIFYFILFLIIYFQILNIFKLSDISIHPYQSYQINNITYLIFYLLRYITYMVLFNIICTLLYINFKEKITLAISSLFLSGFLLTNIQLEARTTFTINPWSYFTSTVYSSFINELCFSSLFLLIIQLIIFIIYKLTLKNKRWSIQ